MSEKKKTVFKGFDYMHCDDFAKYLSDMAAKGWHFKEWGLGLKFEKGEPAQATYAVEVFTDASEYDLRPEPHTKAFAEYCEAAGWKLIDAKQKFVIFKKIQEDTVPILTPEERLNNVCKEQRFPLWTHLICNGLMAFMTYYDLFGDLMFEHKIFSAHRLFFFSFWAVMFLESLYNGITFLYWKWKRKKQLQAGEEVYLGDEKKHLLKGFPRTMFLVVALILAWNLNGPYTFYYIGGLLAVLLIFAVVMNKIRPDSDTHFILQSVLLMVIFVAVLISGIVVGGLSDEDNTQTEAPLYKADYIECTEEIDEILLYADSNMFGSRQSYIVQYKDGYSNDLFYDIYTSEYEWIMNRIWDSQLEWEKNETVIDCTAEWQAEIAFRNSHGEYYVRYEDTIFILQDLDDIILTQDQIDVIRDKLDLR